MAERLKNMQLLMHAVDGINRTMELKSLLLKCMNSACDLMDAEASSLMLLDEASGDLHVSIPTGPVKDKIRGMKIPRGKGIANWVLENKQPYLTNEKETDKFFFGELSSDFKTRNLVCVPFINSTNKVIGVIQVLNKSEGKDFLESQIPVFETLAGHIALSIEKVHEIDDLKKRIEEKENRIKRVHKKLKNNLDALSTLIQVEENAIQDDNAQFILKATRARIESFSNANSILVNLEDLEEVELGFFVGKTMSVVSSIFDDLSSDIHFEMNLDRVQISPDIALSIGLIINEVLIYMYRDSFVDRERGCIKLIIKRDDQDRVFVSLSDDGNGILDILDGTDHRSMGSVIIRAISNNLDASIHQYRNEEGGTTFQIISAY